MFNLFENWLSPQLPKPIGEQAIVKYNALCTELKKYRIKVKKNRKFILPRRIVCHQTGSIIVFLDKSSGKHLLNINMSDLTITRHSVQEKTQEQNR